jgi:hypothetical protein
VSPARVSGYAVAVPRAPGAALVLACVAGAGVSLLGPWALAFDPQAWVIWGADAASLSLDTVAGPAWKPLAVLVTTALAPAGSAAAVLWLVVARAGGLLAIAGALQLGRRLDGGPAGVVAAVVVLTSDWWLLNTALGNSEGLLAAAVLWAFIAHVDGRWGAALALALAAGLLRPETWPFVAAYAAWTWRACPDLRVAAAAIVAAIVALWLLPDLLGAGGALRAAEVARGTASPESAQHAAVPGLAVLADAAGQLTLPGLIAATAALIPWRAAGPPVRAVALTALGYVVLVAVSTQAGFAGNPRYLAPAAALGAVVAGIGAARLGRASPRGAAAVPAVCAAAVVVLQAGTLRADAREVAWRAEQRIALDRGVARAGGVSALRACGAIRTAHLTRALVAWRFGLALSRIAGAPVAPGVLLRARTRQGAALEPPVPRGFWRAADARGWEIWTDCDRRTLRRGPRVAPPGRAGQARPQAPRRAAAARASPSPCRPVGATHGAAARASSPNRC